MPPAFVTRHAQKMCRGKLSVPVVFGDIETRGLLNSPDAIGTDGGDASFIEAKNVLTLPTGELALVNGSAVTVDDVAYKVRGKPMRIEDGTLTVYWLVDAT